MNMSELSFNESVIASLNNISQHLNRYVSIFIFIFGVVGNILNIFVLSQRSFRSNSCAWLFLVSSIVNLISILSGLITRMMNGWATDPADTIGWFCKLRAHVVFATRTSALWLIVLATIDRWLLSSINVHHRQMSTLKNAQRGAIAITIFSILLYVQMFYCYDANLVNTPLKCYGKTVVCRHITDLSFALITVVLPILLMVLFGLMTISNMYRSQRRVQTLKVWNVLNIINKSSKSTEENLGQRLKKKTDHSLLRMLFIQIILLSVLTLPLSIQKFYSTFSGEYKSPIENAIDMFIYNIAVLIYFISNGMPFYMYTLCGGTVFRKALFDFLEMMKRKIMCQ